MFSRLKDPNTLRKIGLAAFAAGGVLRTAQPFVTPAYRDLTAFICSMLMGMAIPCLLMSLRSRRTEC
jgi:hypothetical protein